MLLPWTCGVDADQGGTCGDLSTQAALMFKARQLGLRPKAFTKTTERFEAADLDRWGALCTGAAFAAVVGAHVQLRVATAGRLLKNCRSPPPQHTHRHDVLVAVDRATKDAVLRLVDPRYRDYYDEHVRLLSEYGSPELLQVRGLHTCGV